MSPFPLTFLLLLSLFQLPSFLNADTTESVAIIGGGFSGLSAAYHLIKKGYSDVTLYESSKRVGGYVSSVPFNDVNHDMATYALTPAYWKFQEAMTAIGAQFCTLQVEVIDTKLTPPESVNIFKFMADLGQATMDNPDNYLRNLAIQVAAYGVIWKEITELEFLPFSLRTDRLFPMKPTNKTKLTIMSLPMDTFINRFRLNLLTPLFVQATDSQAYGPLAKTAALYYLTWVPPSLFTGDLGTIPCGPFPSMQGLANVLAGSMAGKLRLNLRTEVQQVIRGESSVTVIEPTGAEVTYDRVIVTARMAKKGVRDSIVTPPSTAETKASTTLEELQIFSSLFQAPRKDAVVSNGFLVLDSDALAVPDPATSFWGILNAEMRNGQSNPFLDQDTTTRVSAAYYYKERADDERVTKSVQDQVEEVQKNLGKWDDAVWTVLQTRSYDAYFQRWRSGQVRKNMPWAIEDSQGEGNVYYVNAAACGFESVGHVFDCADNLVNSLF